MESNGEGAATNGIGLLMKAHWHLLSILIRAVGFTFPLFVATVFVAYLINAYVTPNWEWLHAGDASNSATIRNIAIIFVGVGASLLAYWRNLTANRQADLAEEQVRVAHSQIATAGKQIDVARAQIEAMQQGQLDERYQRAAELLGNEALGVRIVAIHALSRLGNEYPSRYHLQVMRLLETFVSFTDPRPIPPNERIVGGSHCRTDIYLALRSMTTRKTAEQKKIEAAADYSPLLLEASDRVKQVYYQLSG